MEPTSPNEKVKIILDECTYAKAFEKDEMIHQKQLAKVCKLIDRQIEKTLNKKEKSPFRYRYHETISIFGNRGTGKTSFLYSILAEYNQKEDVEIFSIIDPTLIEDKGHFFLLLLSLINEKVCNRLNNRECTVESVEYCFRKRWEKSLKKLAGGIPSLDGVGGEMTGWQDKTYIMEQGLDDVSTSFHLEDYFHELVELALKILGKKIFIVAFDDIDVDFKKGWPVLEVIRKYLTTPYIITLMTGNLKLYTKNVRKQQWHRFGKELLINEASTPEGKQGYDALVSEIEGQYLLKILKAENRIHLHSVYEICLSDNLDIQVYVEKNKGGMRLADAYTCILKAYGIKNANQQEAYRAYLMTLSLRTQIHFLRSHNLLLKNISVDGETNENPDDIHCIEAFLTRMYARNIDVDLANNMPGKLLGVTLKFLLKERIVAEAYQLQPTMDNMEISSCLMGLSLLFSRKLTRQPWLIFDYWIKIGSARNVLNTLNYADSKEQNGYTIDRLCQYARMFQDKGLRDVFCNIIAYLEAAGDPAGFGCFALLGMKEKARTPLTNRIDSVFGELPLIDKVIGYMPLCILQSGSKNERLLYYSPYTLLAAIRELSHIVQTGGDVLNALLAMSQPRSYQIPSKAGERLQINEEIEEWIDDVADDSDQLKELSALANIFTDWYREGQESQLVISPHLLGKISTRFFYAVNSIQASSQGWKLGYLMHRCIIAFLNAVLIEEVMENYSHKEAVDKPFDFKNDYSIDNLNVNNAVGSDEIFNANLSFINRNNAWSDVPMLGWLINCPLLIAFLEDDFKKSDNNVLTMLLLNKPASQYYNGKKAELLNSVFRKDNNKYKKFFPTSRSPSATKQILKAHNISANFILTKDIQTIKKELETIFSEAPEKNIEKFKTYLNEHPDEQW